MSNRRIRRAIGFRKSDPFPPGAGLDVEVDVIDLMRRKGYPSAAVDVGVEPIGDDRVELVVTVQAGEPVSFVFEGDPLPSKTRRSIAAGYRPTALGEGAALEEVQRETVTALVGLGYLEPRVDVDALPADPTDPEATAVVRVTADGGRRIDLRVSTVPSEYGERAVVRVEMMWRNTKNEKQMSLVRRKTRWYLESGQALSGVPLPSPPTIDRASFT